REVDPEAHEHPISHCYSTTIRPGARPGDCKITMKRQALWAKKETSSQPGIAQNLERESRERNICATA
ncbi:MAG: hypothetical protein P8173_18210, partial [Gammaproteobacteria bacterium]